MSLDFSKLPLAKVYVIQNVAATELKIRENVLAYQETNKIRKAKECKVLLREKDQNIKA